MSALVDRARRGHLRRSGDAAAARPAAVLSVPGSSARPRLCAVDGSALHGRLTRTQVARADGVRHFASCSRGAIPPEPRVRWCCSARPAPRWSTTCSRRRRSRRSGAAINLLRFFALVLRRHQRADVRRCRRRRRAWSSSASAWRAHAGTPSGALLAGSVGSLVAPGFGSLLVGPRRRVGLSQLALPRRLRALLHADSGRREARRQVADRRRRSTVSATRVGGGLVAPGDPARPRRRSRRRSCSLAHRVLGGRRCRPRAG